MGLRFFLFCFFLQLFSPWRSLSNPFGGGDESQSVTLPRAGGETEAQRRTRIPKAFQWRTVGLAQGRGWGRTPGADSRPVASAEPPVS